MNFFFFGFFSLVAQCSRCLSPVSVAGRDTNPSQVSSKQMLVIIYLPRKGGKPR